MKNTIADDLLVKFICEDSLEYRQACQLRYELFFEEHNLPFEIVFDRVANSSHGVITKGDRVIAYGRLTEKNRTIYQIKQLVVAPAYQKMGLGTKIVLALIALARQKNAAKVILDARIEAVPFYQKLGFVTFGREHPSPTTNVPHIYMKKILVSASQS